MAQLLIKADDAVSLVHELGGLTTIGRHPESTVLLDHDSVSTRHAEIALADGVYFLKDLISRNGTMVNGKPIMLRVLKHGDQIRFGKVHAEFSNAVT